MNNYVYFQDIGLVRIPERNTKDDIINFYNSFHREQFIELFDIVEIDNLYIFNQTSELPPEYSP